MAYRHAQTVEHLAAARAKTFTHRNTVTLQILSIRRPQAPGADARFDIAITEQLRLFGLCLTKNANGAWRTYAPRNSGVRVASFHPALADQITRAAVDALEGRSHDGS